MKQVASLSSLDFYLHPLTPVPLDVALHPFGVPKIDSSPPGDDRISGVADGAADARGAIAPFLNWVAFGAPTHRR